MERNQRYNTYNMRRQGSGNGPHNHHHHNSSNNSNSSTTSTASSNTTHNSQYSNNSNSNSINNASAASQIGNSNALYAAAASQQQQQQNVPLSQHDELIRYIREAWNKVSEQGTPVIYCNESDNQLKNFKPFNLEEYWGQRLVQNIHVTTTHAGGHQ